MVWEVTRNCGICLEKVWHPPAKEYLHVGLVLVSRWLEENILRQGMRSCILWLWIIAGDHGILISTQMLWSTQMIPFPLFGLYSLANKYQFSCKASKLYSQFALWFTNALNLTLHLVYLNYDMGSSKAGIYGLWCSIHTVSWKAVVLRLCYF